MCRCHSTCDLVRWVKMCSLKANHLCRQVPSSGLGNKLKRWKQSWCIWESFISRYPESHFFLYSSISSPLVFAVAVLLCPALCRPTSAMCTLTVTLSMLNTLVRTVWDSPAFHTNGVLTRNLPKTRMRETHGGGGGELGIRSTIFCLVCLWQSRFAMVKRVGDELFSNAVHAKYRHPWPCSKEEASIVLKFCEAERQPRIVFWIPFQDPLLLSSLSCGRKNMSGNLERHQFSFFPYVWFHAAVSQSVLSDWEYFSVSHRETGSGDWPEWTVSGLHTVSIFLVLRRVCGFGDPNHSYGAAACGSSARSGVAAYQNWPVLHVEGQSAMPASCVRVVNVHPDEFRLCNDGENDISWW